MIGPGFNIQNDTFIAPDQSENDGLEESEGGVGRSRVFDFTICTVQCSLGDWNEQRSAAR